MGGVELAELEIFLGGCGEVVGSDEVGDFVAEFFDAGIGRRGRRGVFWTEHGRGGDWRNRRGFVTGGDEGVILAAAAEAVDDGEEIVVITLDEMGEEEQETDEKAGEHAADMGGVGGAVGAPEVGFGDHVL